MKTKTHICLRNGQYLNEQGLVEQGNVVLSGDRIVSLGGHEPEQSALVLDITGKTVIPGFIDVHIHGAVGVDLMYATPREILTVCKHLGENGTTSFLATTITSPDKDLRQAVRNIRLAAEQNDGNGAAIEGIHVEGPFINPAYRGCQKGELMRGPRQEDYDLLRELAGSLKLHFTVAPEMEGALEFIAYVHSQGDTVSIGHTACDDGLALEALQAGAVSFTHLFNAMSGVHQRRPGAAVTALLSDAFVELICDGVHVHPQVMEMAYRLKGKERLVLVTDAMQAAGLGDGIFEFGGFKIEVKNGVARKSDGTLASSTLTMLTAVRNCMELVSATWEEAVQMASLNPARLVGVAAELGSISVGKKADVLVVDGSLNLEMVFCQGVRVK